MAWMTTSYKSKVLNRQVMIDILVPQGHGEYKTLYLLHGAGGDHSSWILKSRIADYVDNKNIVVVMPSGENKFYINTSSNEKFDDYISCELIDKIETYFNVSTEKKDRYIAGMSMGGFGAFNLALNHPLLYNTAFSYSGLLNIIERFDNPQGIDMSNVFKSRDDVLENYDLFKKSTQKKEQFLKNVDNHTKFSIECGLQDIRLSMSKDLYQHMLNIGYDITFSSQEGNHNWDYWDDCIKRTIKSIIETSVS